jgi:hypothetical protein
MVGADFYTMLQYLFRKGKTEAVGSYFRNKRMSEYEEHPDAYLVICHTRSRIGGEYGRLKFTAGFDDHPGRRGWKQFLFHIGKKNALHCFCCIDQGTASDVR